MTKRQLEIYNFIKNFIKVIQKDYLKKIGNTSSARRIIIHRDYQKGGRKVWKGSQV
jgi:lipopolysaccharide export system protein LptA